MRTLNLLFAGLMGLAVFTANGQTISLTSATATSNTNDASTSVRVGTLAGNGASSTGGNNTFVGYWAGKVNTSGLNNSFLGASSGKANTTGKRNTFFGSLSGQLNTVGTENVFLGASSGLKNVGGSFNVFSGYAAGAENTSGGYNTFNGYQSGLFNTTGAYNTFIGSLAGYYSIAGVDNIFMGNQAGYNNTYGSRNVYIGKSASYWNTTANDNVLIGDYVNGDGGGNRNTMIGAKTGLYTSGSDNIFIGYNAGLNQETSDKKLFIDITDTATPLIWGDFTSTSRQVKLNGKVGTGGLTTFPIMLGSVDVSGYSLFAKGGILTPEIRVTVEGWADYVFKEDYQLPTLAEVENHIKTNGHLINVPSESQVLTQGIEMGQMSKIQQEKIEELTLYIIEQNKINDKQAQQIEELRNMVKALADKK